MNSINYTKNGIVLEWPSEIIIPLGSDTAAMDLQMKLFLAAMRGKSVTFGMNNESMVHDSRYVDNDDRDGSSFKEQVDDQPQ